MENNKSLHTSDKPVSPSTSEQQEHNTQGNKLPKATMMRDRDRCMPMANITRIMRRILPPHAKISDDVKETMQECVSEFIKFVTTEANARCWQEKRVTVGTKDVISAMKNLGFDNYVHPLTLYMQRYKEIQNRENVYSGLQQERHASLASRTCENHIPAMVEPQPYSQEKKDGSSSVTNYDICLND